MFLEHQISILEWFLKDHVTLKTGVMAAENSVVVITRINYILKYIQIKRDILNWIATFHNITALHIEYNHIYHVNNTLYHICNICKKINNNNETYSLIQKHEKSYKPQFIWQCILTLEMTSSGQETDFNVGNFS